MFGINLHRRKWEIMANFKMIAFYSVILGLPFVLCFITIRILKQKSKITKIRVASIILEGGMIQYVITLFSVTLVPFPGIRRLHRINLAPLTELFDVFVGGKINNPEYVLKLWLYNTMMFVPFGIMCTLCLRLKNKQIKTVFLYGAGMIIFIGTSQYFFVNGRIADINDVITNMLGIYFGYILTKLILKRWLEKIIVKHENS